MIEWTLNGYLDDKDMPAGWANFITEMIYTDKFTDRSQSLEAKLQRKKEVNQELAKYNAEFFGFGDSPARVVFYDEKGFAYFVMKYGGNNN